MTTGVSPLRARLLHLRPRSWPVVFAHYATGAAVAYAFAPGSNAQALGRIVAGGLLWTVCLNGGTLALNSAYDHDTDDIGYLDHPPPVPEGMALTSFLLMLIGLAGSFVVGTGFGIAYGVAFVLSLLYSVPPVRLKAVAGADILVNMAGYGALTFAAGALATGSTPEAPAGLGSAIVCLSVGFAVLFAAFYPMTQIYQVPEDRARGDRTLVVRLGARRALILSLGALAAACACGVLACLQRGVEPWGTVSVIGVFAAWMLFTFDWLRRGEEYPAQKGMYRALKLWAVTDIVVIAVFGFGMPV